MKPAGTNVKFSELEDVILKSWGDEKTFRKQDEKRKNSKEFTFYDGPPFANGLPHYGHLLANTIKDSVTRYWVMQGFYVDRRFGWDCHGLPVEYEIEKTEKLKGRPDILKMGVDKFNETCRSSVLKYASEWRKTIDRLGRWVDWDNQYRTMDTNFMESVWWVFSELYRKGLVYKDFKVVPYSPRTTSVVSNFEANQNYKDTQDPAITVKLKVKNDDSYLLAWTTTPWTLISNLALCIGEDIDYVKIKDKESGEHWILAEARIDGIYKKPKKKTADLAYEIIEKISASKLKGTEYEPLFPYFKDSKNAFKVVTDNYVTTGDGTGIVHQAPAYGEDDFRVCKEHNIELVDPVDENGCFKPEIKEFAGQYVKDADKNIIKHLKDDNKLVKHDTLLHSYPFCERTDTPLIYKAIPAWYVAVEPLVKELVENNDTINWVPEHIRKGRMGKWLEGARDWAISRNRFWGTPLPIWVCDKNDEHIKVIGSVQELEKLADKKIDDIHKHKISNTSFACEVCNGTMKPVEEVFDCWFESGSMPYAQKHYPFENKDTVEAGLPADFIAEGLDQTRGWFYTLSVLSTALFKRPAFKNVIVNGIILDETGRKMSKRHRNYTPPDDLLNKYGSDSVRLYLLNSPLLKGDDLIFKDKGVQDTTRAVILPLWNSYTFLSTYGIADGWTAPQSLVEGTAPKSNHELDKWIISKLQTLLKTVHGHMEDYKLYLVVPEVLDFIEDLTNWYIRLGRRRFWGSESSSASGVSEDQDSAYSTLFYVLVEFSKIFAPFAPFISDTLYRYLTDGMEDVEKSVHLTDIPKYDEGLVDSKLEEQMDLVRRATNLGRSLRQKHKIKTRQVLPSFMVITRKESDADAIKRGESILKSELNLKEILFTTDEKSHVRLSLKPNLRTLGKKLGKQLNEMRNHLTELSKSHEEVSRLLDDLTKHGSVTVLGHCLTEDDFLIDRGPKDDRLIATESGVTVLLDTTLTPELIREGLAREVINRIQNQRKDSGLEVSDRIRCHVIGSGELIAGINEHKDYICAETLSKEIKTSEGGTTDYKFVNTYDINGTSVTIGIEKV